MPMSLATVKDLSQVQLPRNTSPEEGKEKGKDGSEKSKVDFLGEENSTHIHTAVTRKSGI